MMNDSELANLDEDEYDEINDETFGDFNDSEAYDWEAANAILEKDIKNSETKFSQESSTSRPPDNRSNRLKRDFPLTDWEEDDDCTLVSEMEANVSRLVMDDSDDDWGFEIGDEKFSASNPTITNTKSTLPYFTPPQVHDRIVGWLSDKGSDSILGSSVWGMAAAKAPDAHGGNSNNATKRDLNDLDLKQTVQPDKSPVIRTTEKPVKYLTLDDVEQEFFRTSVSTRLPKSDGKHKPIMLEDLEREMLQSSVKPQVTARNGQPILTSNSIHPPMPPNLTNQISSNEVRLQNVPRGVDFNSGGGRIQEYNKKIIPVPGPQLPSGNRFRFASPHFAQQSFARIPYPHPGGFYVNALRNRQHLPENFGFVRTNSVLPLMNERDKQRLRNIQIIQLQNDHPHRTDYYYQMFKIRKNPDDQDITGPALSKLFPASNEVSSKSNYQPAHFENSLGKIQAVSALAPKKVFDNVENNSEDHERKPFSTRQSSCINTRKVLFMIEKCYKHLQIIKEISIKLDILHHESDSDALVRAKSISELEKILEKYLDVFLTYRKGRVLVFKSMPFLSHGVALLIKVFQQYETWEDTFETRQEHLFVLTSIANVLFRRDTRSGFEDTWHRDVISSVLGIPDVAARMMYSKLGFSMINVIVHATECYGGMDKETANDATISTFKSWSNVFDRMLDWGIIPYALSFLLIEYLERLGVDDRIINNGKLAYKNHLSRCGYRILDPAKMHRTFGLFDIDLITDVEDHTVLLLKQFRTS